MEINLDRRAVCEEMEQARKTFHSLLLNSVGDTDLRRQSSGTKWNNEQLLFHMLVGCRTDSARASRGFCPPLAEHFT